MRKGLLVSRTFATKGKAKGKKKMTPSQKLNYVPTRKDLAPPPKPNTCVVLSNGATFPMFYSHPSVTPGKLVLSSDTTNSTLWMSPKQLQKRQEEAIKAAQSGKYGQGTS